MIDLIEKGGIFMYPILLCSVVALAVFIERLWVLRRKNILPDKFILHIEALLKKKNLSEAIDFCRENMSSISKVFLAGLNNTGKGMWFFKEAIEERGSREAAILEKNVGILSTIADIAPLIGLLGTVDGMRSTFQVVVSQGVANPGSLAGGIEEALITTATGLCVAIPALACHRFLKDKADALIFEMEESSIKLVEIMESISKSES